MQRPTIGLLGGGWLGEPLAQALQGQGHPVKVTTASAQRHADLSKTLDAYRVQVAPDQVVGAIGAFLQGVEVLILNIPPLKGTPEVEQFAALQPLVAASTVRRVLFVSSTGVYRATQGVVTEDSGAEKTDHKLYRSEQVWRQTPSVQTTVLRLAGLIGGQRHPGRFFQRRGEIPAPDAPVNLIHRDDVLRLIQAILEQDCWGEVLNGCADAHPTKGVFYPKAAAMLGVSVPTLGTAGAGAYKIVSNEKAKGLLGIDLLHPDPLALLEDWC